MSASVLACSTPVPGPFYWDWKCLRCGHAVAQHKSWWQKIKPSTDRSEQ